MGSPPRSGAGVTVRAARNAHGVSWSTYRAGAGEHGAAVDGHSRIGDRAAHHQRAGAYRGGAKPLLAVSTGRGADLHERAGAGNHAAEALRYRALADGERRR